VDLKYAPYYRILRPFVPLEAAQDIVHDVKVNLYTGYTTDTVLKDAQIGDSDSGMEMIVKSIEVV
jgi:hypothetical protein